MEPKKQYKIEVSGKVQGVGFRYSTRSKANMLGLTGIVRNLPNKNVYIEVEGNLNAITEFIKWCKKGPEYAKVASIQAIESEVKGYTNFDIIG